MSTKIEAKNNLCKTFDSDPLFVSSSSSYSTFFFLLLLSFDVLQDLSNYWRYYDSCSRNFLVTEHVYRKLRIYLNIWKIEEEEKRTKRQKENVKTVRIVQMLSTLWNARHFELPVWSQTNSFVVDFHLPCLSTPFFVLQKGYG